MDERIVIHLFQDLPGADCGDDPGVLGDKLGVVGRVWFQVKRGATRQDDRGQEKGQPAKERASFFHGIEMGSWVFKQKSPLARAFGNSVEGEKATFCSRASREAKFHVGRAGANSFP